MEEGNVSEISNQVIPFNLQPTVNHVLSQPWFSAHPSVFGGQTPPMLSLSAQPNQEQKWEIWGLLFGTVSPSS